MVIAMFMEMNKFPVPRVQLAIRILRINSGFEMAQLPAESLPKYEKNMHSAVYRKTVDFETQNFR